MTDSNHSGLPTDPGLAGKVVESQSQQAMKRLDRGWIGVMFGTRDHVPNNVAALIAIGGFLALGCLMVMTRSFTEIKDAVSILSGISTLALGFLFGRASKD